MTNKFLTEENFFKIVEKTFQTKWVNSILIKKQEPKIRSDNYVPLTDMHLFTENNEYIITIDENNKNLKCNAISRKARAGEDWKRGNNIFNGPLTENTWNKIVNNILCYELVKIHHEPKIFNIEVDATVSKNDINKIIDNFKNKQPPKVILSEN